MDTEIIELTDTQAVRLDTFNRQGRDFYKAMGYEQVGHYRNSEENYEEYFFKKRI